MKAKNGGSGVSNAVCCLQNHDGELGNASRNAFFVDDVVDLSWMKGAETAAETAGDIRGDEVGGDDDDARK